MSKVRLLPWRWVLIPAWKGGLTLLLGSFGLLLLKTLIVGSLLVVTFCVGFSFLGFS